MSDPSPAPRGSGRGGRTREALIQAGRRLFAERPVDAVSIDDIVQAADVAKGSFYNHFSDKDALQRAITAEIRTRVERSVTAANAGVVDPARRAARAVCCYVRYAIDEPVGAGVLARIHTGHTSMDAPLNRGLVDDISEGLASGRFSIATLESGVLFVMGVAQITLVKVISDPSPQLAVTLAQQMCALLLRGLGVAEAEANGLAAQAADEIVRCGAFRSAAED